jgi:hypothetical protein
VRLPIERYRGLLEEKRYFLEESLVALRGMNLENAGID